MVEKGESNDLKRLESTITTSSQSSNDIQDTRIPQTRWRKIMSVLEVEPLGDKTMAEMFLFNKDLKPVEAERRVWSWYNFIFFWIAESFNVNTWQIASTGVVLGLAWWQVWISVWLGYFIAGCFITISSRVGSCYHISFPVACRSSFGIYGSVWPVINRVVMACVWYAVQNWIFGQCMQITLMSIFGTDLDTRIPNLIPSSGTTSFQFLGYFLTWLISLPFIWFPPHQIRHLFTVKAYIVPVAGVGFLLWTVLKADGIGPVIHAKATLTGSAFGWAFVSSTMNSLANFATLIVNSPDFSRFADTKIAPIYSQLVAVPVCFSLTSLIGILVSSASASMYGETYWSPLDVLARFLDNYSSGNRAGVFFISVAFGLAQLGTNISANSLSAGTDMTALMPRFITIRRGGYVCAAISICICPWNLMESSNKFTTYLSAYAIFLSAIAGVVAADYYFIRRGYIVLEELYSGDSDAAYTFNRIGCNWRAYAGYISGILPNIVGFVGNVGTPVPIGATYVYNVNFFVGFIVSYVVYSGLSLWVPMKGIPQEIQSAPFKKAWLEEYADVEDFNERMQVRFRSRIKAAEANRPGLGLSRTYTF
ncbi:hypothetical protein BABINDRAFT_159882 [Babjeviella inositovora NRRL Y-12698]|uniref:Uracil permease n=1 Tax=Babjeviella inositovora NRRL Y-12698 TaxID=984486 RepID=A0A1E3QVD1_9ASCO|nr:uncharacterized protein BABINDRAFT_159882 [Babjeviella inositovora NRRL Y-12698]ODQ81613.1 hypothetical protein BABINDRAFT_159882 [Babjeviella inositovora NRRL Y-12698]